MESCTAGYSENKPVLQRLDLRIDMDDRIALLGPNGNGKSTFAKLLAGRLQRQSGHMQKSSKLKIGFFAQHQLDEMNPDENAFQHLQEKLGKASESQVRSKLGQFGFSKDKSDVPVRQLSGGEKSRLTFCLLSIDKPHLLILDEPTNHLDVDAREALVQGLNDYEGAVLLISHDPHLVSLVADTLWLVADGTVSAYDGDINDYKKLVMEQARAGASSKKDRVEVVAGEQKADKKPRLSGKEARKARAAARAALSPKRKEIGKLEKNVQKLEQEKSALEVKLASPGTYDKGPEFQAKLVAEIGKLKAAQEAAEAIWMSGLEELESLENT